VFSLLARRKSSKRGAADPRADAGADAAADPGGACSLASCGTGARATVIAVGCGETEACRLRALGLCEGASVSVVDARQCMLLEVRGARLALGASITAGITVLPHTS
jgi:Fe2+ transport system protein FeoA